MDLNWLVEIIHKTGISMTAVSLFMAGFSLLAVFIFWRSSEFLKSKSVIFALLVTLVFSLCALGGLAMLDKAVDLKREVTRGEAQRRSQEKLAVDGGACLEREAKRLKEEAEKKVFEAQRPLKEKLVEKLNEVVALKKGLDAKRREVTLTKEGFVNGIEALKRRINERKEREGLKTFLMAKRDQQILLDLSLVQSKIAYRDRLQEIENRLNAGYNDVDYMEAKTRDDLKMAEVLSREEMDKLIGQIERTLNKYAPDIRQLIIATDKDVRVKPLQDIWDNVTEPPAAMPGKNPKI